MPKEKSFNHKKQNIAWTVLFTVCLLLSVMRLTEMPVLAEGDEAMLTNSTGDVTYTNTIQRLIEICSDSAGTDFDGESTIKLLHNVDTNEPIVFNATSGRSITLDLNGFTLNRGLGSDSAVDQGYVIINYGNMKIQDKGPYDTGMITGGNTTGNGGGIYNLGQLTIVSGKICGNKAAGNGGGIYNAYNENSKFGGLALARDFGGRSCSISDNTAYGYGGGVYNSTGTYFNASCGAITGNTVHTAAGASAGGGVYNAPDANIASLGFKTTTLILDKDIIISGNTSGPEGNKIPSNFYLPMYNDQNGLNSRISLGSDGFTTSAEVGITTEDLNVFTNGHPNIMPFFCDDDHFTLNNSNFDGVRIENSVTDASWGTNETYSEGSGTIAAAVAYANSLAAGTAYIRLNAGTTTDALDLAEGKETVLDLNNKYLRRGLGENEAGGYVIKNAGKLTIKDTSEGQSGTIRGGHNTGNGGGIINSGVLTLNGVTVTENCSENGGGVYNSGFLTLENVSINGNDSESGGGIYNSGECQISGSEIKYNYGAVNGGGICNAAFVTITSTNIGLNETGGNGGGIYNNKDDGGGGQVTVCNNVDISTNKKVEYSGAEVFAYDDFYLYSGQTIIFGTGAKAPAGSQIYVKLEKAPTAAESIKAAEYIFSDDADYNTDYSSVLKTCYESRQDTMAYYEVMHTISAGQHVLYFVAPGSVEAQWSNGVDLKSFGTLLDAKYYANTLSTGQTTIKLLKNIILMDDGAKPGYLEFSSEVAKRDVVLDLNGHTLSRSLGSAVEAGYIIVNNGKLLLKDSSGTPGKLTGGNNTGDGGCIYNNGGTLTISGIEISGNASAANGGGVYSNGGTLTADKATISGNTAANGGGVYSNNTTVNLAGTEASDVKISDNTATTNGGGVYSNGGTLTVDKATISGNTAANGGGIYSNNSIVSLAGAEASDVKISDNTATANGGGIYNAGSGTLNLTCGTVSGNTAAEGGGICNLKGTLQITGGTISGNKAVVESGGGVYNIDAAEITGGEISGNTAVKYGGGLSNAGSLTIEDGKINGNSAGAENAAGESYGGGVYNAQDSTVLINGGEISDNTAKYGGGVYNGLGTLTVAGGNTSENSAANDGGGIYNGKGVLKITDGTISGNKAANNGGGIYCDSAANKDDVLLISGGTIKDNTAEYGGGLYHKGDSGRNNALQMSGGKISDNTASVNGGGVYSYYSKVTVGGGIVVSGNTKGAGDNLLKSNLTLGTQSQVIAVGTGAAGNSVAVPETSMLIGVTTANLPVEGSPVAVTASGSADYSKHFVTDADRELYLIQNQGTGDAQTVVLALREAAAIWGADENYSAGRGSISEALQYANTLESGTAYIKLLTDIDISSGANNGEALTFGVLEQDVVRTAVLEMDGHTIDRGLSGEEAVSNGYAVLCLSNLTIKNTNKAKTGLITGANDSDMGGGIMVGSTYTYIAANLTIENITVSGNQASWGGGIAVYNRSSAVNLNNVTISGNTAKYGGGIASVNGGALVLNNTTVSGNAAHNRGGGVDIYGDVQTLAEDMLIIGGSTVVRDNTLADSGAASNFCLPDNVQYKRVIVLGTGTGDGGNGAAIPTDAMHIGISTVAAPTRTVPVDITKESGSDYGKYFVSDKAKYLIQNSGTGAEQKVQLALPQVLTVSAEPESGFSDLKYGYKTPNSVTFTIKNISSAAISGLKAEISEGGDYFSMGALEVDTLAPGAEAAVTVTGKTGLPAADAAYAGTLNISWTDDGGDTINLALSQTVNKAAGSVTDISSLSQNYDGNPVAAPTYTSASTSTDVTVQYRADSEGSEFTPTAPKNAGNYIVQVTVGADTNYDAATSAETKFTISPAKVSISGVTVEDKIYDGSPAAVIDNSGTLSVNYDGDNLTIDTAKAAAVFDNKNVGSNKAVAFSGFALGGSAAANYELQAQPESVKAAITACPLTVNVQVKDKQYDGTTLAELTAAATLTGVVAGDDVQLAGGVPSFASSAVGEDIAISFTEFTISGANAANYTLTQPTGITASITNDYNAVKGTDYTVNSNDWLKTDFVVTAREGYQLSLTNTDEGSWQSELKAADETANGTLAFYVRQVSTGAISNQVSESYKIDKTVPVISGVTDRATYYTTQVAAVTDANLLTVTLNGTDTASPVTLAGNTNIVYTIVAQDAAGNTASCQVTMKKIDSLAEPLDGLTVDNVKSSDQAAVEQLLSDVEKQLTDNAATMTEAEKTELQELQTQAQELLTEITETADEITHFNWAVEDYSTNPNLNDAAAKEAIKQLISAMDALLSGQNLTEAERTNLLETKAAAQALLNYYQADNSEDASQYTVTTEDELQITLTDDDDTIDDSLTLIVRPITTDDSEMSQVAESLQGIVEKNLLVLDIYFVDANGVKQPVSGNMTVTITLPAGYDADSIIICYIDEDGNVQELDCTVVNGQVTFTTDHNSIYVVGEKAAEYCNGQEKLSTLTDGTFELYLGGVYAGSFTFAQGADGWSIMDAEGHYLALQNGQLLYTDEAFYWSYARDKFSAREQKSGSGWGWWNRFFNRTTTYYLSLQNGTLTVTTSSKAAQAEFYAASDSSTHQYGEWSANGDQTHSRTCSKCADVETQACYDNDGDDLCDICGTYLGEAYVDVSVKVTQKSSGWWWFSRTTYTAQISAAGHGVTIAQVQYSQDGSNWQKGSSFSSRKPIKSFYIKVTDSNGTVTKWQYAGGAVQQLK